MYSTSSCKVNTGRHTVVFIMLEYVIILQVRPRKSYYLEKWQLSLVQKFLTLEASKSSSWLAINMAVYEA